MEWRPINALDFMAQNSIAHIWRGLVELPSSRNCLVLANPMKHFLCIAISAALAYMLSYAFLTLFSQWYEPKYINNDDELGVAIFWSFLALLLLTIGGAYVGHRYYVNAIRRNSGNPRIAPNVKKEKNL